MSSDCAKVESEDSTWQSHDPNRLEVSSTSSSSSRSVYTTSRGLEEKVERSSASLGEEKSDWRKNRTEQSSSHLVVLAVSEISEGDSGRSRPESSQDNGRPLNISEESDSRVTSSRPLENNSSLQESQDLRTERINNSEMGNTHWSHSYTGVRQPLRMRPSCRSDSVIMFEDLNEVYVPIIGYEMMEQRAKFTVFKLHVQKNAKDSWFIFRRYTDFERLNEQLAYHFPNFRLALPPKKWFGNNFDLMFLEDRQLGLQAFLNNICGHKAIVVSDCVREFLCVDDPPGPHDSLEESRALCESLEDTVYNLKRDLVERDRKITALTEELNNSTRRIEALSIHQIIRSDRVLPLSPDGSDTTDMDRQSCAEADQQDYSPEQEERPIILSFTDKKLKPASEVIDTKLDNTSVFTSIPLDKSALDTKNDSVISTSLEVIRVT